MFLEEMIEKYTLKATVTYDESLKKELIKKPFLRKAIINTPKEILESVK